MPGVTELAAMRGLIDSPSVRGAIGLASIPGMTELAAMRGLTKSLSVRGVIGLAISSSLAAQRLLDCSID